MKGSVSVIAVYLLLSLFVAAQKRPDQRGPSCPRPVDARLRDYFESSAIEPSVLVNNEPDPGLRKTHSSKIPLPGHEIEWIDVWNSNNLSASIKIDGDLISFKGQQTINAADDNGKGKLDLVEDWRQARLYELSGHDI
ncbi:MAG: hypothetical protein ABI999_17855, partial [Acidobacteriota bacterium]